MKNVYVVTSGSYSDYGIRAIFSSRKVARDYINRAKVAYGSEGDDHYVADCYWANDADIEVWPLDEGLKARKHTYWSVGMLLDDGSVKEFNMGHSFSRPQSRIEQCGTKIPCYNNRPIVRVVSVKSEAHARKLAAEARQAWLRERDAVKAQAMEESEKLIDRLNKELK